MSVGVTLQVIATNYITGLISHKKDKKRGKEDTVSVTV